jgi:membrane protein CcdC involved in cytochrome C biogenesis
MHQGNPNPWIGYAVTAVIVTIVLAIRLKRMNVLRPLKLEHLWILPAFYLVLAATMFVFQPPDGIGWPLCGLALVIGAALGWSRGRMIHVEVDPETRRLSARQSPAAVLFIVVLIVVRQGLRAIVQQGGATGFHLGVATLTDMLIALALGLLTVQRVEMYLRAKRLLEASRDKALG